MGFKAHRSPTSCRKAFINDPGFGSHVVCTFYYGKNLHWRPRPRHQVIVSTLSTPEAGSGAGSKAHRGPYFVLKALINDPGLRFSCCLHVLLWLEVTPETVCKICSKTVTKRLENLGWPSYWTQFAQSAFKFAEDSRGSYVPSLWRRI